MSVDDPSDHGGVQKVLHRAPLPVLRELIDNDVHGVPEGVEFLAPLSIVGSQGCSPSRPPASISPMEGKVKSALPRGEKEVLRGQLAQ